MTALYIWQRSVRGRALIVALALATSACTATQTARTPQAKAAAATHTAMPAPPTPLTPPVRSPSPIANPAPPAPAEHAQILPGTGVFVKPTQATKSSAQTQSGDITLNFVNADVHAVLPRVLGDILHLNYTVDPKVRGTITIQTSRPIRRQDVLPVLEEALRANGLALVEANGIYRVTTTADAARSGTATLTIGSATTTPPPTYNVQILPLKYVSATELQHTLQPFVPKDATMQVDASRNLIILSGPEADLSTITDMVKTFDVDWIKGMSFAIVPLQTGAPQEIVDELTHIFGPKGSVPLPGMLSFAPLERMNAVLVVSPQRAYIEQARMWIERLDRGETDNRPQIYEYHVQNSRAVDLARVLTELFSNVQVENLQPQTAPESATTSIGASALGLPTPGGASPPPRLGTGISSATQPNGMLGGFGANEAATPAGKAAGAASAHRPAASAAEAVSGEPGTASAKLPVPPIRVVADDKNNTLVIYARPRDYQMIQEALKKIDVVPLQVLIEATIAEVTLGNNLQYGLQYFFHQHENQFIFGASSLPITGAPIPGTFPGFNYILGSANANVVLNLLSAITKVHVISSPELLVLDHHSASLLVGSAIPIPTGQVQSTLTASAPLVTTVQYVDTGVILKVTPLVNANGLVTLDVAQEVSAVAPSTNGQATSTLGPSITERRLETSVTLQNGETVALGGLIEDTTNRNKEGLPLLSDIPVVGSVFGSTSRSFQRTELLVLLTPTIVRDAAEARAETRELRRRLHALANTDLHAP